MKNQTIGLELELTGITRLDAARVLAKYFGTTEHYIGGSYRAYEVQDQTNRVWKLVYDSSIQAERKNGEYASDDYKVEMVSPICHYEDIETIQEIVRQLRKAGAVVNKSCGVHIHLGKGSHTARSLKNIVNIMASKEDLLFKALEVEDSRAERWCKKVDVSLVERINRPSINSESKIRQEWYNGYDGANEHYHPSRYRALNLHSVWQKGTIEFRCFNASLHAGKIKSYIQLCLAISHQAKTQKSASAKKTTTTNPKYTFRTWLLRLGLIGDEFKTAREHLLKNLDGDIAWRDGRRLAA